MSVRFNDYYHGRVFNSPHWRTYPTRDIASLPTRTLAVFVKHGFYSEKIAALVETNPQLFDAIAADMGVL